MKHKYLSVKEYSELTGIPEYTLRRNFNKGKLKNAEKLGGRIKFILSVEEEDDLIKSEKINEITRAIEHISNGYNELLYILKSL